MATRNHIMLFAGEYSGNIYGAALARELKRVEPSLKLSGTGCREMHAAGVEVLYDSSSWGGIGFIEALRVFPRLYIIYRRLKQYIEENRPDALVLIDYPGFNMFLARLAAKLSIPTLYYFPPGKFAREPSEVAEAAQIISSIAAPFHFTYDIYERAGAKRVEYVGHPLTDVLPLSLSRTSTRRNLALSEDNKVIGLLPGSRRREIRSHTPILLKSARLISQAVPDPTFVIPMPQLSGSKIEELTAHVQDLVNEEKRVSGVDIRITRGLAHETMVASDLLLISSGTATLEATWFNKAMVIIYKASWLTEFLARRFFYSKLPEHFGLPNIIAGKAIVPELIQSSCTSDKLSEEAIRLLNDDVYRLETLKAIEDLKKDLSKPGTSLRVAEMALDLLEMNKT